MATKTQTTKTPEQTAQTAAAQAAAAEAKKTSQAEVAAAKKAQAAADREEAKKVIAESKAAKKAEREATANAPKPLCGCGCGAHTKGGRFLPGHDARLHARAKLIREQGIAALPASLTPEEVEAAQTCAAEGHLPEKGSFAPRWDAAKGETAPVKPRADKETLAKRIAQTRTLLAALEAELAAS